MSDLSPILKLLSRTPSLSRTKRVLVVELSETRLASVLLRPSSIWTYAIVGQPRQMTAWGNQWKNLTAPLSPADVKDLRKIGSTPGGFDLTPSLRQQIKQIATAAPDFILPVGTLCKMKRFGEVLASCLPAAEILEAHDGLSLPTDLSQDKLRQEIARTFPPRVDADYSLWTVALDESEGKLDWHIAQILKKGEKPPTSQPVAFKEHRLCRAIRLQGSRPGPVNIVIRNDGGTVVAAYRVNPPKNIFYLQCWFNYNDDGLRVKVIDEPGQSPVPLQAILDSGLANLNQDPLPVIEIRHYLDIAFIVDGTMRSGKNIGTEENPEWEWKPDLKAAKGFISDILEDLEQNPSIEAQCALCLYGDWPHSGGAAYALRSWPFRSLERLRSTVKRGTDVSPTEDRDYEALLEAALHWANWKVQWRQDAAKFVVVIGYAPPHPPNGHPHPSKYGFKHEPFTSYLDWKVELAQLRQKGIQIVGVWVPYPDLDRMHPCMRYSHHIWSKLGNREPYEGLEPSTRKKVAKAIRSQLRTMHVAYGPPQWPLMAQIHALRCAS